MSDSDIMANVSSLFTFFNWIFTYNVSSILIYFTIFFSWIALNTLDLHAYLILVTKANAVKGGTTSAALLYCQHNQSIHGTGGMTVMSLFANPPSDKNSHRLFMSHHVKTKGFAYFQCQIVLNSKLSHRFIMWCEF